MSNRNKGRIIVPGNGRSATTPDAPQEMRIDGKDYTVDANFRADNAVTFAGSAASQFAGEWLKTHGGVFPEDKAEREKLFDTFFAQGDEWRMAMNRFKKKKLEEYDAEIRARVAGSKLILPTAGQVADSFPPGAFK